jgi:hypothetical protein
LGQAVPPTAAQAARKRFLLIPWKLARQKKQTTAACWKAAPD